MHFRGASDAHDLVNRRRLNRGRARDEGHLGAAPRRFGRNREPHPSARPVSDVTDRVDVLVRGTGRHQHAPSAERTGRPQNGFGGLNDFGRLGEPAFADPPAGEIALARLDEAGAAGGKRIEIAAHGLVLEHLRVHGRGEEQRRARGRIERGEEIVGDAVGQLADDVGRRRRDQE